MTYQGTVQHGIIVLNNGQMLPEGAVVQIVVEPKEANPEEDDGAPSIWDDLVRLGREVESLPCDLPEDYAINHDHYLYGTPKRQ
jgi:hypothetical protein